MRILNSVLHDCNVPRQLTVCEADWVLAGGKQLLERTALCLSVTAVCDAFRGRRGSPLRALTLLCSQCYSPHNRKA